ncbi:hypothetical protein LguiA_004366 [Lonicera macranthoides]
MCKNVRCFHVFKVTKIFPLPSSLITRVQGKKKKTQTSLSSFHHRYPPLTRSSPPRRFSSPSFLAVAHRPVQSHPITSLPTHRSPQAPLHPR